MLFIFFVFQKYVMVMEVSCLLKLNIGEGGNTFLFNFKCSRWQITNTLCQINWLSIISPSIFSYTNKPANIY